MQQLPLSVIPVVEQSPAGFVWYAAWEEADAAAWTNAYLRAGDDRMATICENRHKPIR